MRLEINGIEADVTQLITLTRQVIDIENMATRLVDVTNSFSLPKTNVNQQIFESGDIVGSDNNKIDGFFTAKIIDQFFLFNGYGYINEINGSYKFQLIELSKSIFDNMNKPIKELDFESDDFTYNIAGYNSLKLLSSSVWVWPIISMHEKKTSTETVIPTTTNANLTYLRPSFRLKTILDKAFEDNNWSITYDPLIDQLAISSNHENFYVTSYQKTLDVTYNPAGTPVNLTGLNTNDFENVISTTNTVINIGTIKTRFRLRGTIITNATITIIFKGTSSVAGDVTTEQLTIYSGTNEVDYTTGYFETSDAGHNIEIFINGTGSIEFDDTLVYTIIEEEDLGDLSTNQLIGYRVKAYDNLPEIDQIDIFRLTLVITNSVIIPSSLDKSIELKNLNYSKNYNYDWSDKFVQGSENIKNILPEYAQTNYLEYDNDETVNPRLGRSSFIVNNTVLKDEQSFITLNFGASNEVDVSGQTIAHFNIYGLNPEVGATDYKRINTLNKRLVYCYNDGGGTYTLARFLQVDWGTIKANYYEKFFNSLYRLRYIEAYFNLNKLDVLGFDFERLVYVDYFKSNFIVLGIEDFRADRFTKVKMLKYA